MRAIRLEAAASSGIRACAFGSVSSRSSASDSMPTAHASGFAVYVWPWKKCFISARAPRKAA